MTDDEKSELRVISVNAVAIGPRELFRITVRFSRRCAVSAGVHDFGPRFALGAGLTLRWCYFSTSITLWRYGSFLELCL